MLDTHVMERTDNRSLQKAPNAFNGVGMDFSADIFILGVIDRLMPGIMVSDASVGGSFIGKDCYRFRVRLLQDYLVQGLAGPVVSNSEDDFSTTFHHANHQSLIPLYPLPCPSVLPPTKVSSTSTIPSKGSVSSLA